MIKKLIQKISTPAKANTTEPNKTPGFIHSMVLPFSDNRLPKNPLAWPLHS
jgi:hypothetical protein